VKGPSWRSPSKRLRMRVSSCCRRSSESVFIDLGSATNSCQKENRIASSPGYQPCIELQTRAGTWLYDANKEDQHFSARERYATGLRNGEGFAFDSDGRLFATMHGRDQLSQNWPSLFTADQNAQLPAEEIVQLEKDADYGWPELL
jgi:glucose/arabinose dehydrogenase